MIFTSSNLRVDRLATLYVARPLRHIAARLNQLRVPILMYHSVSENHRTGVHPYFTLETSPEVFEMQMKYLRDAGYQSISTADVITLLTSGQTDGKKYVVITFDDGYRDFYTHAFPIMNKFGLGATVYLPTAYINHQPHPFKGKDCLTWSDVRDLHRAGVVFGSHTVTHPKLRGLCDADLERELRCSKEKIESELGVRAESFAYPYAFPDQDREFTHRLRDLLKVTGYHDGVSTVLGTVQSLEERFFLRRVPANTWDDLDFFRAKLEGDYDWLHWPQRIRKRIH
jgi:peptidoglycan/xylan/chitin deacetylase (PgdA/CDA1 family)